jgi:glycosyltransferase involved in cell wall biosynthesis
MRILFLVPKANVGGLQTTLRNRINALQKRDIYAEVVFFSDKGDGEYIFKDIPYSFVYNKTDFQNKISRGNFNFLSYIYSLNYIQHIPKTFNGKIIYEVRGWSNRVKKTIGQIDHIRSINAVICIAKYLKPLCKNNIRRKIPIFVDGNTVDPMFRFIKPDERKWEDCPYPSEGRKVIGFIGRVEESKNWREFVEICENVSQHEKIEMWFICNPNTSIDLEKLQLLVRSKKLDHITKVIPHVPNHFMPEVYSVIKTSGGCILSTSFREGLGNGILEPMACGLPVISSNVPGKNEVIDHTVNGMLYKLGNIEEAVQWVLKSLQDMEFRHRINLHAIKKIKKHFNQEVYVNRYLRILSRL